MDNLESQIAERTIICKKLVIHKLEELIENPLEYVTLEHEGLCYQIAKWLKWNCHVHIQDGRVLKFLSIDSSKWEFFSGSCFYPVPCPDGMTPDEAFYTHEILWIGEYGKRRLEFCKFVLEELKQQLEKINEN